MAIPQERFYTEEDYEKLPENIHAELIDVAGEYSPLWYCSSSLAFPSNGKWSPVPFGETNPEKGDWLTFSPASPLASTHLVPGSCLRLLVSGH